MNSEHTQRASILTFTYRHSSVTEIGLENSSGYKLMSYKLRDTDETDAGVVDFEEADSRWGSAYMNGYLTDISESLFTNAAQKPKSGIKKI